MQSAHVFTTIFALSTKQIVLENNVFVQHALRNVATGQKWTQQDCYKYRERSCQRLRPAGIVSLIRLTQGGTPELDSFKHFRKILKSESETSKKKDKALG